MRVMAWAASFAMMSCAQQIPVPEVTIPPAQSETVSESNLISEEELMEISVKYSEKCQSGFEESSFITTYCFCMSRALVANIRAKKIRSMSEFRARATSCFPSEEQTRLCDLEAVKR